MTDYIEVTQREIDRLKLTKKQEEEILANGTWDERFRKISRQEKLDGAKRDIIEQQKELALGLLNQTQERLHHRLREVERILGRDGKSFMDIIMKSAAPAIKRYVKEYGDALTEALTDILEERAAELEKRIAEVDAKPVMRFKGVWDVRDEYERGHVVTENGSLWSCVEATKGQRPGKSPDWRLIAKAGSASRNAD